jgi:E3 ubiquitin-protein ligase DOA10
MIVLDAILAIIIWTILAILTWPGVWRMLVDTWRRYQHDRRMR